MSCIPRCLGAAAALALAGACSPSGPRVELSLEGAAPVTDQLAVDFGAGEAGGSYTRWVKLTNEGDAPTAILGWTGSGAPDGEIAEPFDAEPPLPLTLEPGRAETLWLRFRPQERSSSWATHLGLRIEGIPDGDAPRLLLEGRTLPRPCNLSLSETAIDFGLVPGTGTPWRTLTIRNASYDPYDTCAISNLRLEEGGDPRIGFAREPSAFETLGARDLTVATFKAVPGEPAVAEANAVFAFEVVGVGKETVRVPITARFPTHCLTIDPPAIDFGLSACGGDDTRTIELRNACDEPVELTQIRLGGEFTGNDPTCFTCPDIEELRIAAAPAPKAVLAPGGTAEVVLAYRTVNFVRIDTRLEVRSLVGAQLGIGSIPVRAEADLTRRRDADSNPERPRADVLVVVDDGPSMASKAAIVAANVKQYFSLVGQACTDANVGVLSVDTSDPATAGVLVGPAGDRVLNWIRDPADRAAAEQRVGLPSNSSSSPTPLEAIRLALSEPLASGANTGFRRPGTDLVVVIATDRADASPQPLSDYQAVLNGADVTTFVAAGFDDLSCGAEPDDGTLQSIADHTSNVCENPWPMFGWGCACFSCSIYDRTSFPLSSYPALPYPDAIQVTIDGVPLPWSDEAGVNWSFDPEKNSIEFTVPPPAGSLIEFDYAVPCGP